MIQLSGSVSKSPSLAAQGGEREQQSQVGREGARVAAAVEVEVEVVVVADHGVAEAVGGHGEFQRQEERLGQSVVEAVAMLRMSSTIGGSAIRFRKSWITMCW